MKETATGAASSSPRPLRAADWLSPAALLVLTLAFFSPGVFLGQLPVFRDLLVLVFPLRQYTADALSNGELPLWVPELFFGAPYLANHQSAVLYPPSLIPALAPPPAGLSLYLAFHVFVAALGAARYLERVSGVGAPAALFGAVVFAFGGFIFSLVSLANQLAAAAWLPWVLLAADRLRKDGRARSFVALCLMIVLQLLAGAPEPAVLTGAIVAGDLVRHQLAGRAATRGLALCGAAYALAVGISAAQLLPTSEYVGLSNRADGLPLSEVSSESLEPSSILQFVLPHTFEGGAPGFIPEPGVPLFWSIYLGITPLVLVIAALVSRPPAFWLLVAAVAALLAMGSHFFLFPTLYALVPSVVGAFRFPGKFFLPAHFALSMLAAIGLARVLEERRSRIAGIAAACALAGSGIALSMLAGFEPEGVLRALGYDLRHGLSSDAYAWVAAQVVAKGHRLTTLAFLTAGLIWLFSKARVGATVLGGLLTISAFADLFTVHQPSLVFTDWDALRHSGDETSEFVRPGQRVFHYVRNGAEGLAPWLGRIRIAEPVENRARALWAAKLPDLPLLDGTIAVAGVDGFAPRERIDFYHVLASAPMEEGLRLLAAFGTERLVGSEPLTATGVRPILSRPDPELWVYELPSSAPRTYLADRAWFAASRVAALARVASPEFRPGRDAVLPGHGEPQSIGGGTIEAVMFGRDFVRAEAILTAPGLWVVSDTWFPGWEATIDGLPAEILPVNGIGRGVRVPKGKHRLEMRYRPASFRRGALISLIALILLPAGAGVVWWLCDRDGSRDGGA